MDLNILTFLRRHKNNILLKLVVKIKRSVDEIFYYLLFLLFPKAYKKYIHFANGTNVQIKLWSENIQSRHLKKDFLWGDLFSNESGYNKIKNMVYGYGLSDLVVLELGSYSGVWTQHFISAKKIICVDVMDESFDLIKKRINNHDNIVFYKTSGNELKGVNSKSVDIVFCIDTLMRLDLRDIELYIGEISRVLRPHSRAIIHLPSISKRACQRLGFTYLTPSMIKNMAKKNFQKSKLHHDILLHGIVLEATK